jgi:hypothetical protein
MRDDLPQAADWNAKQWIVRMTFPQVPTLPCLPTNPRAIHAEIPSQIAVGSKPTPEFELRRIIGKAADDDWLNMV